MSELFREIEEDLRRERLERLWKRAGKLIIGLSLMVVVATVVVVFWQESRHKEAMAQTHLLIEARERIVAGDYKMAMATLEPLVANAGTDYYGLAMLYKAQAQLSAGDADSAEKTMQTLAANTSDDQKAFVELAKLSLPATQPAAKGSIFYYTQQEQHAWELLKQNKKQEAISQFALLRDDKETPTSQRQRILFVLSHLAPELEQPATIEDSAHD